MSNGKQTKRAAYYEIRPKGAEPHGTIPIWQLLTGGLFLAGGLFSAAHSFSPILEKRTSLPALAALIELLAWGTREILIRTRTTRGIAPKSLCLPVLPWLVFGLAGGGSSWRGFAAWLNLLAQGINLRYGTGIGQLGIQYSSQQVVLAAVATAMVQACVVWIIVKRRRPLAAFGYSFIWILLLVLQGQYSPHGTAWFLLGILCILMTGRTMSFPRAGGPVLLAAAVLLEVGAALCGEGEFQKTRLWRESAGEQLELLRYGQKELPKGDLTEAGLLGTSESDEDAAALFVYADQGETLYLKGYTGSVYQNGQWSSLENSSYSGENAGMLSWLHRQGFDPQTQAVYYWTLGDEELMPHRDEISITVVNASKEQMYIPYTLVSLVRNGKRDKDLGIRSTGFLGNPMYRYAALVSSEPCELMSAQSWVLEPENEEQERYLSLEAVYRQFVYENYTQADVALSEFLNEYFWLDYATEGDGIYRAVEQVRKVLSSRITYAAGKEEQPLSGDPGEAAGTDALTDFLTQSRQGNSAWFATAAVMALRVHGIPARYAEGYYAAADDYVHQEKGTALAELTARNEHAWVEVYLDGVGWLPVDVTPGYYLDAVQLQNLAASPDSQHKMAELADSDYGAGELQQSGPPSEEKQHSVYRRLAASPLLLAAGAAALFLMLATAVLLVREAFVGIRMLIRRKRYQKAGSRERAMLNVKQIKHLLSLLGMEAALGWGTETLDQQLSDRLALVRPGEYRQVCRLLEKTLYGGIAMEIYEERTVLAFLDKLREEAARTSWRARIRE